MTIKLLLPMEPFGAARHRARAMPTGKRDAEGREIYRAQIYKKPEYREWCDKARPYFRRVAPKAPYTGPLVLSLVIVNPFLKSARRKVHVPRQWHWTKPDGDNIEKACMDVAESAGWFLNDAQVSRAVREKVRAAQGEPHGLHIVIKKLETPYHLR